MIKITEVHLYYNCIITVLQNKMYSNCSETEIIIH